MACLFLQKILNVFNLHFTSLSLKQKLPNDKPNAFLTFNLSRTSSDYSTADGVDNIYTYFMP